MALELADNIAIILGIGWGVWFLIAIIIDVYYTEIKNFKKK